VWLSVARKNGAQRGLRNDDHLPQGEADAPFPNPRLFIELPASQSR
jgi:hypothetical protein